MSEEDGRRRRIEFVRPDPTKFVFLIAATGRGSAVVAGTQNFKPGGTEWATDQDMRDAGYVPLEDAKRAVYRLMAMVTWPSNLDAERAVREAMELLGITQ